MPYSANHQLPSAVRTHLPDHAQDIFREAFNHAYATYTGDTEREKRAHMIAWAAVKRSYAKDGERWVPRSKVPS